MIWQTSKEVEHHQRNKGRSCDRSKGLYHKGTIKPFDIKIHKGEVVGLSGLLGSGRSELVRAIYGADKPDGGELYVKGEN